MSEEIDYAEMLEIPVATVNITRKKRRRFPDWKGLAVGKVNKKMEQSAEESVPVRDGTYAGTEYVEPPAEEPVPPTEAKKEKTHPVVIVEFAVACALAIGIFLTNVFLPDSAINTFIRTTFGTQATETVKSYSDFTLTGIVSEYADAKVSLTDDGILTLEGKASVYPACAGTVASVEKTGETYTVVVEHSASFTSEYKGVKTVYAQKGDAVRPNVPFAYAGGEESVQVSFYENGNRLNCFSVDAQNCLSWNR